MYKTKKPYGHHRHFKYFVTSFLCPTVLQPTRSPDLESSTSKIVKMQDVKSYPCRLMQRERVLYSLKVIRKQ